MNQSEKIKNQILKDFSLDNYENLFKGSEDQWFLIDHTKTRRFNSSIQTGEYKYCLHAGAGYDKLWIGGFPNVLEPLDEMQVLCLIRVLDSKYSELSRKRREKEKNDFISKIFPNL